LINNCAECGIEFESPNAREYCSHKCYHKHNYTKQEIAHVCEYCGKDFTSRQKRTKFCSIACGNKYRRNEKAEVKHCRVCGKELGKLVKGKAYCSKECDAVWVRENPRWERTCQICGDKFRTNEKKQDYCSYGCLGKSKSKPNSICLNCSKEYNAPSNHAGKFCSRECFVKYTGMVEINNYKYKSHLTDATAIKRAKRYGVAWEYIDPLDILERDEWVCGICLKSVNKRLLWPHPMSASLDHIIPLSKFGTHTKENVQTSHLKCNCSKGSKVV